MTKKILEVEIIRSGQARPRADRIYEAYITLRNEGLLENGQVFFYPLTEEFARVVTRWLVRDWQDGLREGASLWSGTLARCEPVGPTEEMVAASPGLFPPAHNSRWHVMVAEPHAD